MRTVRLAAACSVLSLALGQSVTAAVCPGDSVLSGTVCMDKYEASLWYVPPNQEALINKIQLGKAELSDLTRAGAVQLGLALGDLAAAGCPATGNGCVNIYSVSIAGVRPAAWVTRYQAVAAARNSLKRLPTNQEWQAAALGTPDGASCNVGPDESYPGNPNAVAADTGSAPGCVSNVGAFDMVGNLWELVADWRDSASGCFTLSAAFGNDLVCTGSGPVIRGGFFGALTLGGGTNAGVFASRANFTHDFASGGIGFRCAR